jgi:hypothetical protein
VAKTAAEVSGKTARRQKKATQRRVVVVALRNEARHSGNHLSVIVVAAAAQSHWVQAQQSVTAIILIIGIIRHAKHGRINCVQHVMH